MVHPVFHRVHPDFLERIYMPKTVKRCLNCGAEVKGKQAKAFCSNACVGEARTKGLIGAKKRRGSVLTCEVCTTEFYRKPFHIKNGRHRFCSEECRLKAHELRMVDRTQPRPKRLKGKTIACVFCGTMVYRKKSMLERNIGKTCGDPACVSAYGRSLWGLSPRKELLTRPKRKYRSGANFTAMQIREWLADRCAFCGTTDNLTLDHIIPVCCGGRPTRENAQTLCGPCNNWKSKHFDRPMARKQFLSGG